MPTTAAFRTSNNFTFNCSYQLREFLLSTVEAYLAHRITQQPEPGQDTKPRARHQTPTKHPRLTLATLCRTGLQYFLQATKPIQNRHIGPRLLSHPRLPHNSCVSLSASPSKYPTLRADMEAFAERNDITVSTVLRRAAYTYAVKLQEEMNPDFEENPQLILDAWLNVDNRGKARPAPVPMPAENYKQTPDLSIPRPKLNIPVLHNPQQIVKDRAERDELLSPKDYQLPKIKHYYNDPDLWVTDNEWGNG